MIQNFWRNSTQRWLNALHLSQQFRQNHAAITIQCCVRLCFSKRRLVLLRKIKRVALQQSTKEQMKMKRTAEYRRHGAALVIQQKWKLKMERRRCKFVRMRLRNEKRHAAATRIQLAFRSHVCYTHIKSERVRQPQAAVIIQCFFRCWFARRRRLQLYRLSRERPHVIPNRAAPATSRKRTRMRKSVVDLERTAAVKIQAQWRGFRTRKKNRRREARAVELSRRKANRARHRASTTIQKRVRGIQGRRRFWLARQTQSTLVIQRTWRGFCMRRCMQDLRVRLRAVFVIKKYWRQRYVLRFHVYRRS